MFKKMLVVSIVAYAATIVVLLQSQAAEFVSLYADTSQFFSFVRVASITMLAILLFTNPPRALGVRWSLGLWSIGVAVTAIYMFASYQLLILDAVLLFEVAILCGIEALETKRNIPISKKYVSPKRIKVLST